MYTLRRAFCFDFYRPGSFFSFSLGLATATIAAESVPATARVINVATQHSAMVLFADTKGSLHQLSFGARAELSPPPTSGLGIYTEALPAYGSGYLLDTSAAVVDYEEFGDLFKRAQVSDPDTAIRLYDEALQLWRGPAFDEFAG